MKSAVSALCATVSAIAFAFPACADTYTLKLAHFVVPQHPHAKLLQQWADLVDRKSGGKVKITVFPNGHLGPAPRYYDMARTGQADITWFAHGFTPGRFPLTSIAHSPYLFGSAEIGSKVLNEPALREYLDKEHVGVRPLWFLTNQPVQFFMRDRAVRSAADFKGLRIQFGSPVSRAFIAELGATPVGMPPTEVAETMQKGTLDGATMDYGGAGIAFRIGPVTKFTTETYALVISFCMCMNQRAWDALGAANQTVLSDAFAELGGAGEPGRRFDSIDGPGKGAMTKAGTETIKLSPAEDANFRKIGAAVTEKLLADLEAKGQPARAVHRLMVEFAAKHEKSSKSFWK